MTSITIELPDDLAARAQRAGVLRSGYVNALIEEATQYAAAERLRGAWSSMDAIESPAMSAQDIVTHIKAVRAAHKAAQAAAH